MRLHRFIGDYNLSKKEAKIFDKDLIKQIRKVFRMRVGDRLILSDGNLNEAECRISKYKKESLSLEILDVKQNVAERNKRIILFCSILKGGNFEIALQKATEVGVSEIIPLLCKRTVKLKVRKERLEKIIREAAEQSGRGIVPILGEAMNFDDAAIYAAGNSSNYLFDMEGKSVLETIVFGKENAGSVGVFIGPEGGWEEQELESAKEKGFKIISLSDFTFRAETAAIIATYLAKL